MAETVTVTIDDKQVTVAEGTNLIDAADAAGVHIPNLCYLKGMRGIGACRMCLVEVEGMKAPIIGCTTKAKDGMVVQTRTDNVQEIRKFVIDLIVSMHPLDCMTCTKAGACNLQEYAYDFEVKESSFTRKDFGYPVDEANPFIKRDPDYCVLCGRCVRVCKEQGTEVLDFMGRGVGAKVATAMDKPLQESECTFCGSCVDACPVNALLEADNWRKGREWEFKKDNSACLACGNGCDILIRSKDDSVIRINSGAEDGSAEKYLCAIGRFGHEGYSSDARIMSPMKKVNGELQETTWEEALEMVADQLKAGDKTGIVSTASILNEDAQALSQLASNVINTKNVDTTASLYSDTATMLNSDDIDLDTADVIIVAGLNPSQWDRVLPALDAAVRRRAARGAKLISINEKEIRLASAAAIAIQSDEAAGLAQIAKSLIDQGAKGLDEVKAAVSGLSASEDAEKAAELIAGASSPVVLCSPSLFNAARNLSLISDVKVAAVPAEANARGVAAAGLTGGGKTYTDMVSGGVDALYVIGDVPLSKRPDAGFVVVQASYMSDLARAADVVLPAASYLESDGSITGYLGRTKAVNRAITPAGNAKQHKEIFCDLAKAAGADIQIAGESVRAAKTAEPAFHAFEKQSGLDADPGEMMESMNANTIAHSKLLWLREAQKASV